MKEEKCEGIVLKSYAYRETERIFHLFTLEFGIIYLIVKSLSPKNPQRVNLTTPLCQGQYIFRKRKSNLFSLIDGNILTLHLSLRQSFTSLQIGSKMLQAIHLSQLPETPAPKLYQLLSTYLKKLPISPETLWTSFQLKLLKHEGLISLEKPQIKCASKNYTFNLKEWEELLVLLEGRSFSKLTSFYPSNAVKKNIGDLFSISL